ncbi:unnamed protein product [Polarella glacialis]|uniref:J domain-containing protein n=1 Tax=Polarella glacialis TaxID=89957 RepID=A0A813H7Y8_POLGL|nr:unnamed protein product [Polarella glacialis]CAE8633597.1 unnamed protein product [Polarella glacialis]CAE8633744.1 unnamed protein product [Polarella glacialis]CAE8638500.1 unnamed protein product [Polarella glacialis]
MDFAAADHYAVLGVPRGASEIEITRAYKAAALRHHPDKNQNNKAEAEVSFKRISEAYAVLRNAQKRSEYDQSGTRSYVSYEEAEEMWRTFGGSASGGEASVDGSEREETRKKALGLILILGALVLAPRML